MDVRDEFQPTARELLERHINESNQLDGPERPEQLYRPGYVQGHGDYVSETTAARENNARINAEYYDHAAQAGVADGQTREALEQHIERSQDASPDRAATREALEQHFRDTANEINQPQYQRQGIDHER